MLTEISKIKLSKNYYYIQNIQNVNIEGQTNRKVEKKILSDLQID